MGKPYCVLLTVSAPNKSCTFPREGAFYRHTIIKTVLVGEVKNLKKIFGLSLVVMFAISFAFAGSAFAGADKGKSLFDSKKCKTCHKAQGDAAVFKPVGPGLKGVGKRHSKEWLAKWLSPANVEIWEK